MQRGSKEEEIRDRKKEEEVEQQEISFETVARAR